MTARGRLLSGLVTMVIALAGFVTFGALPAAANSDNVQYVALGDSYAAGVGAPPHRPVTPCLQSDFGYPGVLDSAKRIDLQVNAACIGATTDLVARTQLSALNPATRLVTLTVGGNDLGFAGLAGACTTATTPEEQLQCVAAINDAVAVQRLTELGRQLRHLYADEVADRAPDARIVVTGYPFLFERPADNDSSKIIKNAFNQATARLNTTIEQAVAATREADVKIVYVDVTAAFAGHGIGSSDAFINDPSSDAPGAVPFHPNAAGYNAYADAISDALPNGWLDKTSRSAASS
jgi:lysophospholipase L1-like esterase